MSDVLKAPYPWFGGKSRVAHVVWKAFGDVPNFVDPFYGSGAVLLCRPGGAGKIETVNDRDRYVANFTRAIKADPWGVAEWCDDPVNEADLHARHKWLVNQAEFRERMHTDPDYFDAKIAGWWCWGLCCWIGGGWCVEPNNHKHPKLDGIGKGVHSEAGHAKRPNLGGLDKGVLREPKRQLPALSVTADGMSTGRGVHSEQARGGALRGRPRPNLNSGQGVHAAQAYSPGRRPSLGSEGQGVHLPSLGNDKGIHGVSTQPGTFLHALHALQVPDAPPCFAWFQALALRLRRVRVACGDWRRVLSPSVLGKGKNVGGRRPCAVFLDPPYSFEFRDPYLYSEDDASISAQVREWAIEHGDDPDLRVALCGYEGEHEMPANWQVYAWKAARGYASEDNDNRSKERIWFSPHCLPLEGSAQRSLFEEVSV